MRVWEQEMIPMTTIKGWGGFPDLVIDMVGEKALNSILQRHDLPVSVLHSPDHSIPLAKMMRVIEAAARKIGDNEFGVRLGHNTSAADYGTWAGYAYCAPTLGQALSRVCATLWAHESGTRMYLAEHENHVVWSYNSGLAAQESVRHFSDHLFHTMFVFFRSFLGSDWRPDWVEVDYDKPEKTEELEKLLNTTVRFSSPNFGVAVRKADLDSKLMGQIPFSRPLTRLDLRTPSSTSAEKRSIEHLLNVIDLRMMEGAVDIDGLARVFDFGPRTLQRRLNKLGYSYKQLLELSRRKRAAAFLKDTELPVKAIAAVLGYERPQNFTRAFHTWYAASPSQFRHQVFRAN